MSATVVDLSQGYYHLPLRKKTQRILTKVLPFGKYAYKRLPMGLASASDISQLLMMIYSVTWTILWCIWTTY